MEKTKEVLLQDERYELLNAIIKQFEWLAVQEIKSDAHSYNDCAVRAKMWLLAAVEIKKYKSLWRVN